MSSGGVRSHSLQSFQQALALDSSYASAYAGYASALDAATTFGIGPPDQLMPKALAAVQRAIQLDPQNGEAYTELGSIQTIYLWDWTAAGQNLTRGIEINPNDAIAEFQYAVFLDAINRPSEALSHMRRALILDPLSFLMNRRLGVALYLARDYDAALAQLNRAAEMEHDPRSIDNYRSLIYEQKGQHDEAIEYDLAEFHSVYPQIDATALRSTFKQHGWQAYWLARSSVLVPLHHSPAHPTRLLSTTFAPTVWTRPSPPSTGRWTSTATPWHCCAWTPSSIRSATIPATRPSLPGFTSSVSIIPPRAQLPVNYP